MTEGKSHEMRGSYRDMGGVRVKRQKREIRVK